MITVALNSPVPLHDQLVAQLRHLIASGKLGEGDELPPVRQLANDLGINLNTVARAYRELTDDGLLASARGRGTVVHSATSRPSGRPAEEQKRIEKTLAAALADAKLAGLTKSQTRTLLDRHVARLWSASI